MVAINPAHLVGTGGAIGALCRYYVTQALQRESFPIGTVTVNVVGSFLLGVITFAGMKNEVVLFGGVGAVGSFTTFSSFSFETVRLWEDSYRGRATVHAVGTLVGALVAIGLAWGVVTLFYG